MTTPRLSKFAVISAAGRLQSLVIAAAAAAQYVLGTCEAAIDRAYDDDDGGNDSGSSSNNGSGSNGQPRGPGSDPGALTRGHRNAPPLLMLPVTIPAQPIATATPPLA